MPKEKYKKKTSQFPSNVKNLKMSNIKVTQNLKCKNVLTVLIVNNQNGYRLNFKFQFKFLYSDFKLCSSLNGATGRFHIHAVVAFNLNLTHKM